MIFAKRMNSSPLKRLSEYFSVFHSKIIIFDDKIIFTGSNLSKDYFLNRIDRYYSLENKEMAEYLKENFFNFLIKNSKKMNGINVIPSDIKFECENFKGIRDLDNFNVDKTLIYEGKSELTILKIIKDFKFDEIYISTAYLNFPKSYFEILKDLNLKIFVSDPETNKFKNYGMFCGTVTELYKYSTLFTAKKLPNAEIYEFRKDGFTMHGKGIWAFSKTVCLTTIGSSNLNRRSFERDSELNVLLITKNLNEIEILREEVKFMFENSKRRTISELKRRRYNVFVILLFFLLNPFL
jgi:CDP-diacylglycerol--glycerol-3-phosphate 3-phosphatidyltransferase